MKRLQEVRESRGLSQSALAKRVGVTQQAIAQYESGKRTPTGDVLVRLAQVLGVSSSYLLGLSDSPQRDDHLPPDWEQVVEEAMSSGFSPDDVRLALRMLKMALKKDKGGAEDDHSRP